MGYHRAGFDVVGVDLNPKYAKRYPFEFHAADAIEFVKQYGHEFNAIHASPPCQAYSVTKHSHNKTHPELIEPVREALVTAGLPYVIENVVGAPLVDPLILCGSMFDLTSVDRDGIVLWLRRHRLFESNLGLVAPKDRCDEYRKREGYWCGGVYGGGSTDRRHAQHVRRGGYTPDTQRRKELLGIDWMTNYGMTQSVPPAYTEYLGRQLIAALEMAA